jgi:hypothetical protein
MNLKSWLHAAVATRADEWEEAQAAQYLQLLRHPLLVTHPSSQIILPM